MIEEIKVLLGDAADNFTDEQIGLAAKIALMEVEIYCRRKADYEMELAAISIAKIKLNRMGSEGLSSNSFSGVSESYLDGYPEEIKSLLNSKRKIKVV